MKNSKRERKVNKLIATKPFLSGVLAIILTLLCSAALLATLLAVFTILYNQNVDLSEKINSDSTVLLLIIGIGLLAGGLAVLTFFGFGEGAVSSSAKSGKLRFPRLSSIDIENAGAQKSHNETDVSLEQLCVGFRNFAASKLGLYYDMKVIRSFISSLCVSKLMIIQGISGTGKTSIAWAFGEYLGNGTNIVSVQPSWKEKTDLIGYYNEFTGKFNETLFLESLYKSTYTDKVSITLLDEMNIARVEYYFAEFLSMLEIRDASKRLIDVIADSKPGDPAQLTEGRLAIPDNVWYIGTANRDDSTYTISDKVYDRAMILQLDKRCDAFEAPETSPVYLSEQQFGQLKNAAINEHALSEATLKKVLEVDSFLADNLEISFGNRIMGQYKDFVPCYVACNGSELEATDVFIATKILRKLEAKSAMLVKREYDGLIATFDRLFGEEGMPECRKYLRRYEK